MASRDKRHQNESTSSESTSDSPGNAAETSTEDAVVVDSETTRDANTKEGDENISERDVIENKHLAKDEKEEAENSGGDSSEHSSDTIQEQAEEPLPELPESNKSNDVPRETPPTRSRWGGLISVALALAIAVSVAYTWQVEQKLASIVDSQDQANQKITNVRVQLSELESSMGKQLQTNVGELRTEITGLTKTVANQQQKNESQLALLQSQFRKLAGVDREDWLLAEAEYFVKLAQSKLQLENNVSTAIGLLVEADTRLASLNDPSLFDVRGLLAKDIAKLRGIPPIDLNGIVLEINALIEQVSLLPLKAIALPPLEDKRELAEVPEDENTDPAWKERLFDRLADVADKLVKIRRIDGPVEPLLLPAEEAYLRENIKLQLHLAAVGAARGDADVYRAGIDKAMVWTNDYFKPNDSKTQGVLTALDKLSQRPIQSELPTLNQSLESIGIWVDQRIRQRLLDKSSLSGSSKKKGA
jgi:uroporphyrin-3 C-methyltransferase